MAKFPHPTSPPRARISFTRHCNSHSQLQIRLKPHLVPGPRAARAPTLHLGHRRHSPRHLPRQHSMPGAASQTSKATAYHLQHVRGSKPMYPSPCVVYVRECIIVFEAAQCVSDYAAIKFWENIQRISIHPLIDGGSECLTPKPSMSRCYKMEDGVSRQSAWEAQATNLATILKSSITKAAAES